MPLRIDELHFNLGSVLHQQGRYGEAAEHYRQSIQLSEGLELTGDRANAHHSLGIALSHQGQWQRAIACYQTALALQSDNGAIYISLGIALSQCQQLEAAIEAYRTAVTLCPDFCLAPYYLGKAWQTLGHHATAVDWFWQAHRLDPTQALVLNDLLISLAELGRWDDMTQPLQTIATLPTVQPVLVAYQHWVEAVCKDDDDSVAQARWHCAKFLQLISERSAPTSWKPLLAKALWHWGNGLMSHGRTSNVSQAETFYQQAIALHPQVADYFVSLAHCLASQNRIEASIVAARWGLTLHPNDAALSALVTRGKSEPGGSQSSETAPACEGLNCTSCLQQIYQAFEPIHLGRGVSQMGSAATLPVDQSVKTTSVFLNGRVWVAPQQGWQACHAIAVFDQTGERQPEFCRDYPGQLPGCQQTHNSPAVAVDLPPVHRLRGTAALLSGLSAHIYFHWMIDILPRVAALQSAPVESIDWFIINSIQKPFQRETLQRLGVPLDRVVESDRHPHIQADRLVVPPFAAPLGWATQRTVDRLRQHFLPNHSPASVYPSRIYVTRAGARYRRILNEEAVIAQLQSVGVVPVDLETLSVVEQAELFAQATLIVAPHGSGLTNLVFCQPGAAVIELLSSNYVRHYYWPISQLCRLRHYTLVCSGLPFFSLRRWMYLNPLAEDIWVDELSLRRALELALDFLSPSFKQKQPRSVALV